MDEGLIVAGGGIGGMAAALALHRAGLPVALFERSAVFREAGAGMSLWPNATRVLQAWGVLDRVLACGEAFTQFDLLEPSGRRISRIPMGGFATPCLCLRRADLHRCLRDSLPSELLRHDQRLRSFTQEAHGVTARFEHGGKIDAVAAAGLIGADGINSTVRKLLHGEVPPVFRGYSIWRGIAPRPDGVARGEISETWGAGRRFGIMPLGSDQVCWYATHNGPPEQSDDPAGPNEALLRLFGGWHRPVGALIEGTDPAMIIRIDARDRPALCRWGEGRVTLLGDAAHPITPNVGQGACLAIEDAASLAKALLAKPDVAAAFRAYEVRRRGRTASVGRSARRLGAIGQWENPWIVRGRNAVTRLVLASVARRRLTSVYAYEA
jgi:2-polyprenyl-6-methoxyphenol hydroxylase-like FAD-dependent oxidoreductase